MTTYALLLLGLALAGDCRPPAASKVYPVADLLVNEDRYDSFLRLILSAEKDYVPFPESDPLLRLLQGLEKDHVPFPESDLIPPPSADQFDPVLGFYPPSKAHIEKPSKLGYYPPSKALIEKAPIKPK